MKVLDNIVTERGRRLQGLIEPDPHARVLWGMALAKLPNNLEREELDSAFQFAKKIKYHHVGLTSEIYFSHPLRVASISVLIDTIPDCKAGVLAILHNVLEVSDITADNLTQVFGREIADQVVALTVDRRIQWDRIYKTEYYKKLMKGPRFARVVKIVDKLDNLFLLGQNPDSEIRTLYLSEIEDFVLPMVKATLPDLLMYMKSLVSECRAMNLNNSL
jgi:(p)ppGpp synthase/HD superfamily hydrolase